MTAHTSSTTSTNEQPLSSVEISTRQKGIPAVTVKIYHADPDVAESEALRIYMETIEALSIYIDHVGSTVE